MIYNICFRYGWLEFSTGKLGGEYSKHPNWVIYQGLRDIYEAEYVSNQFRT